MIMLMRHLQVHYTCLQVSYCIYCMGPEPPDGSQQLQRRVALLLPQVWNFGKMHIGSLTTFNQLQDLNISHAGKNNVTTQKTNIFSRRNYLAV